MQSKDESAIKIISDLGRQFSDSTVGLHNAIALNAGLTGTDHKYLGLIVKQGNMTAGELATVTGLTTGAVTGLIDRLEKRKLVKRAYDKGDRRKIIIKPNNEEVTRVLGSASANLQQRIIKLMSLFTPDETEVIEKYLGSVIEVMDEMTNDLRSKEQIKGG